MRTALAGPSRRWDAESLAETFGTQHAVTLRSFLSDEERAWVANELERATFVENFIEATGRREQKMQANALSAFMHFKLYDPALLTLIETLTGRGPIGSFHGRTYRVVPGSDHVSHWHNDCIQDRIAACSVNLSPQPFEGAGLEVRDAASHEVVCEIDDLAFGDLVLIQIDRAYEHRNSPLRGTVEKTAHAGFFFPGEPAPLLRR